MPNTAIKVNHLTKVYKLYDKPVDRLKESLHPLKKQYHKEFYALNDVSFEIKKGETVGIIGKNGAGKSTLLKIITGVLTPTSGSVHVNGRIASLLELGAGFNPEYTGMENIYFQGSLMGYTCEEMESKVDDIISFADIGDFIDQPVKMYSSGMFARLAFAVAINVDPDILIVDEVLSVGDMYFQQKCIDKIISMKKNNMTLLFVGHSLSQVKSICEKALYINQGKKIIFDSADIACTKYQNDTTVISEKKLNSALNSTQKLLDDTSIVLLNDTPQYEKFFRIDPEFNKKITNRSGGGEIRFVAVDIIDCNSNYIDSFEGMSEITILFSIISEKKIPAGASFGFLIRDEIGYDLLSCNSNYYNYYLQEIKENTKLVIATKFTFPLMAGQYTIQCGLKPHYNSSYYYDRPFNVKVFTVHNPKNLLDKSFGGKLYVKPVEFSLSQEKISTPFDFIIKNHFVNILSYSEKMNLVKNSVTMIEIETFSFCNRQCWFCPNSFIDRKSQNIFMKESIYLKVLNELQQIQYSNMISFSRYNEPLANRVILVRLQTAKKYLPNAILHLNTNGDYLTLGYLDDLYRSGLRSLNIQCYSTSKLFNYIKAKEMVQKKVATLKLEESILIEKADWIEIKTHYKEMNIRIYARDFIVNGVDRGGAINEIKADHTRISPCLSPFYHIYIDYNGNFMPCCNLRSDLQQHTQYIIGNSENESIYDVYTKLFQWRKSLINYNEKSSPCTNCNFVEFEKSELNFLKVNSIIDKMIIQENK